MAHFRRTKPRRRTHGRGGYWKHLKRRLERLRDAGSTRVPQDIDYLWTGSCPSWHDRFYHSRPKRRAIRALERAALMDRVDADDTAWPLGNHKPHHYYW